VFRFTHLPSERRQCSWQERRNFGKLFAGYILLLPHVESTLREVGRLRHQGPIEFKPSYRKARIKFKNWSLSQASFKYCLSASVPIWFLVSEQSRARVAAVGARVINDSNCTGEIHVKPSANLLLVCKSVIRQLNLGYRYVSCPKFK
jgi:hypothetical protein